MQPEIISLYSKYVENVDTWTSRNEPRGSDVANENNLFDPANDTNEVSIFNDTIIKWVRMIEQLWDVNPLVCTWTYSRVSSERIWLTLARLMQSEPSVFLLDCSYSFQFAIGTLDSVRSKLNSADSHVDGAPDFTTAVKWSGLKRNCPYCAGVSNYKQRLYPLILIWCSINPIDALSFLFQSGGCTAVNNKSASTLRPKDRSSKSPLSSSIQQSLVTTSYALHFTAYHNSPPVADEHYLSKLSESSYPLLNPILTQYACRCLMRYNADILITYIPQFIQASRYDMLGIVEMLICHLAAKSNLLAHQLLWDMKTNCFLNEETPDGLMQPIMERLIGRITDRFGIRENTFYRREVTFTDALVSVSKVLKGYRKGADRQKACFENIKTVVVPSDGCCYLPSNPSSIVQSVIYASASSIVLYSLSE
ncbi:hypothetical protein ACOME3_009559 [Neoechinorhynchus agilis]